MEKSQAFEYFLFKLINWYKENTGSKTNDLSVLKVLKLLFFVSAVNTTKDSENTLLDNVFNNFVAMPYGHVESDIYENIKQKKFNNIIINNSHSKILDSFTIDNFSDELKNKIDNSFEMISKANPNLIKYSSFDLVDLSHSWYSWQYCFNKAKKENSYSKSIPIQLIKEEEKIYSL